jgi:hypothetical protein
MLAGGADEEAEVDLGACSAAKDIVSGWLRWIGCYWRIEEGTVDKGVVVEEVQVESVQ